MQSARSRTEEIGAETQDCLCSTDLELEKSGDLGMRQVARARCRALLMQTQYLPYKQKKYQISPHCVVVRTALLL